MSADGYGATVDPIVPSVLSQVSNEMVRLHKDLFGRGPTAARSNWAGEDVIICVLEGTLTPAERNLVRMGEHQRLRDTRTFFQYAAVREFCEPVEGLTGRTVRGFISGIDTEVDGLSTETFVFYPREAEGPSRAEVGESRSELPALYAPERQPFDG